MTQQLADLLNLPPLPEKEDTLPQDIIDQQQSMLVEANDVIDKIDAALPFVTDLDTTDTELDDLSKIALERFNDLMDLGMNVEARFSGTILQTASTLFGHALSAKQAKIDRKLRTVDLQLKKMRLDQAAAKSPTDGEKLLGADNGDGGVMMDRNELLAQILGKSRNT